MPFFDSQKSKEWSFPNWSQIYTLSIDHSDSSESDVLPRHPKRREIVVMDSTQAIGGYSQAFKQQIARKLILGREGDVPCQRLWGR
jgi:hypothetical protein